MRRGRRGGYTRRSEYYTNSTSEKEVLIPLVNELIQNDPVVKSRYDNYKHLVNRLNESDETYNNQSNEKYAAVRAVREKAEQDIRDMYVYNGFYLYLVSIGSEFDYLELKASRYSSRNTIKIRFAKWFSTKDMIYNPEINCSFEEMTEVEVINTARMMQFTVNNMYKILEIMSTAHVEMDVIRETVHVENNFDLKRSLQGQIDAAMADMVDMLQYSAFVKLATHGTNWFKNYIDDDSKPYMRYALVKNAKWNTNWRIDNFNKFNLGKTKMMVTNTETADFLEIRRAKFNNFIPYISARRYEVTFSPDDIRRAIQNI